MSAYRPTALAMTGATGALGFEFLQRSLRQIPGLQVRLLVRSASEAFSGYAFQHFLAQHEGAVTLIDGDMRQLDAEQIRQLSTTDGGLWHFAARTALKASERLAQEIHEVNVTATEQLVAGWTRQVERGPLFHISTAFVAGQRRGVVREDELDEGQAFRNPYEASKCAAEKSVRDLYARGAGGAIFRPSVVVTDAAGAGDFKIVDACAYAVALAVKRGEPFVFRMPENACINLVHSDWVIAALLDLARQPSGPGRTYHLTAPRSTYLRDIAAILQERVPGLKISFEPGLTRAQLPSAAKIFEKAVAELRPYFESGLQFDRSHIDQDLSSDVTEEALDLAPFVYRRLQTELG